MERIRPLALSAAACAFLSAGCSPRLAGTNDAALEYTIDADPETGVTTDATLAAAGVKARLSSAQIAADVDATVSKRVRVVVDADAAGSVDALLAWRGGLDVYRLDDTFAIAPSKTAGLRLVGGAPVDSAAERWWEGPADAVSRAAVETKVDDGHVVLIERLPTGAWRTHVAVAAPLVELGRGRAAMGSIEPARHGRGLALALAQGARDPLIAERSARPQARVGIGRGRTLLAAMSIDEALATPLVVQFGDDVGAFSRAHNAGLLLASPILPPLHRTLAERLPARWGLAATCAMLPFALSFGWLFFVRRFDRACPEPMWLVAATFALGGLAVVPAALAELAFASSTPWLDPSVMTLGGQAWALPVAIVVFTLVVGLSEEISKFLGAWSLAGHRPEFDEPIDGIVYGCAAALGFAAVENVKYFAVGRMSGAVIAIRTFMTVPAHMFFGAVWGYAMGRRLVSRRASVAGFVALAALAHGTFDAMLSTDGMQLAATLLVLLLAFAFVTMLRHALRYGAVRPRPGRFEDSPPRTEPMPASQLPREFFPVGSPISFYGCAAGMILCALGLTVLGSAYEFLHHRVGVVFVSMATAMLALLGLAAHGASAAMPLDVAVDAQGVTFAGSQTPWRAIAGVDLEAAGARAFVVLRLRDRAIRIGPARVESARAMMTSIRAALG